MPQILNCFLCVKVCRGISHFPLPISHFAPQLAGSGNGPQVAAIGIRPLPVDLPNCRQTFKCPLRTPACVDVHCVCVVEGIWTASNGQTITSMSQQMTIFTPTTAHSPAHKILLAPFLLAPCSLLLAPCHFLRPSPCPFLLYFAPWVVADDVSECGAVCVCVCLCATQSHVLAHTHSCTLLSPLSPCLSLSLSWFPAFSLLCLDAPFLRRFFPISFCGHCGCCSTRRKTVAPLL